MTVQVADFAKEHGVAPGQVTTALADLGIDVDNGAFEADNDILELITGSLQSEGGKVLTLEPGRTPRDIASALGVSDKDVQMTLIKKFKVMATLTTALKDDVAEKLVEEFGYTLQWGAPTKAKPKPVAQPKAAGGGAVLRSPVVTILGHVDHGKTSLLDYIRKANVVDKEHGGITQHIGAYQVNLPEGTITFLDTPGHAAFTAMRARGAQVTDVAILVVAADDGIMPQTQEAIQHAKNADVPIIVAVNKIDKPAANVDKVMTALTQYELVPEQFGGQTIVVPVSAHTGEGVPQLLEMILLQAEVLELKADPTGPVQGVVIEAKLEKGRGPVATILVNEGTLKAGDIIVVGKAFGKIRAMTDHTGARLNEAGPSTPVEIIGLDEVPVAGDKVEPVKTEREGRDIVDERRTTSRQATFGGSKKNLTLRQLRSHMNREETKDLNLVVKGDVQGSVEAVKGMLEKIDNEEVSVKVVLTGVGSITESDILLASASGAIVVGFNVKPETKAKAEADRQKIEIRTYNIIYELIEDIEKAVKGMLDPKFEEQYRATVEIRAAFKLTKSGKVAGCHVTDGKISRNDKVRVKRGTDIVYEGELDSLRNVKQDVREIIAGQDCGIKFEGWEDFAVGDVIEAYEIVQIG